MMIASLIAVALMTSPGARAEGLPIRVLILSGMNNHDWRSTTPALRRIYEESGRFSVEVTEDPAALTAAKLAGHDVVLSNWTNYPAEERIWGAEAEEAILGFVRGGKGFAAVHAASACYPKWPEYLELTGASWAAGQTAHGAIHTFEVVAADPDHPITRGLKSFRLRDELWHKMALQPTAHVLYTAFSAPEQAGTGQNEPAALVTQFGQGRCFNSILGHDATTMEDWDWRLLLLRGTEWAATGQATITVPVDVDLALDAAATYQRHGSRAPLVSLEQLVQQSGTDARLRTELAGKMAEGLASDATSDCKAFLLVQLSVIGGAPEVPTVAPLLADDALGSYALLALQRIPGPEAGTALREATRSLKGTALVGVINALGEKRDAKAAGLLSARLPDEDDAVARAAADALGKVGGAQAIEALQRALDEASPERRAALADPLLRNAGTWQPRYAAPVYQALLAPGNPSHVRMAAFCGLAASDKAGRAELVLGALGGEDAHLQAAAVRCLRTLGDRELAAGVASKLATLAPPVQAQVIIALTDLGEAAAVPAVAELLPSGEASVRLAAVRAVGRLGDGALYKPLLAALRAEPSDAERPEIEKALVGVCRRAEQAGGLVPVGMADLAAESAPTRSSLLRVLGLMGDATSLEVLRAALRDPSADTRLAALRALSEWPDGAPMPDLLASARAATEPAERTAALGSLAVLAPRSREAAEASVAALAEAMALARDAEGKRALLNALAQIRHPSALLLASAGIDDPPVAEEACLAAVRIAQSLPPTEKPGIQAALEKVLAVAKSEAVRTPARTLLLGLGIPVDVTQTAPLGDTGPNLALGATATSPDGIDKDGDAGGDQAAIDGDPATYWDEANDQPVYRIRVTFARPAEVSALRLSGWAQHLHAAKDFDILCDDVVVKTVKDAWYKGNLFAVTFPPKRCTSLELKITGGYGPSPAIRELEIFNPPSAAK